MPAPRWLGRAPQFRGLYDKKRRRVPLWWCPLQHARERNVSCTKRAPPPSPAQTAKFFAVAAALALVAGASALTAEAHLAEVAKLEAQLPAAKNAAAEAQYWSQEPTRRRVLGRSPRPQARLARGR